jgi:hypothetical protein
VQLLVLLQRIGSPSAPRFPTPLVFFGGRPARPLELRFLFPAAEEKQEKKLAASPHRPLRSRNAQAANGKCPSAWLLKSSPGALVLLRKSSSGA